MNIFVVHSVIANLARTGTDEYVQTMAGGKGIILADSRNIGTPVFKTTQNVGRLIAGVPVLRELFKRMKCTLDCGDIMRWR